MTESEPKAIDEDEMADERSDLVARASAQAADVSQRHDQISQMKHWSIRTAVELRTRADERSDELTDDEVQEIHKYADHIASLYDRISVGEDDYAKV